MKVLGIAADEQTAGLVDRLVDRLGDRGRVATVTDRNAGRRPDGGALAARAAAVAYELGEDGWTASGSDRTLAETLDDLAPAYDYAIVDGFPEADVPRVVVGDRDARGTALYEAESVDAVDVGAVVDALESAEPYVTLESLVARAKRSPEAEKAGAIATFTGRVRARDDEEDDPTEYLEFEKYEGVAEERMDRLRAELESREGVYEVLVHHRTGVIEYGEDIVFVVVLAGHRGEAFRTVEDGIDRLKEEVPIFKKEVTTDEEFWVHNRA